MQVPKNNKNLLQINNLHTFYNNIHALKGISIHINEGEIVTLIGNNGAGKTTTLNAISGIISPREGNIFYKGKRIEGRSPHEIVRMGISQVPEGRKIYSDLNVIDNLYMGAFIRSDKDEIQKDIKTVYRLFPKLMDRENLKAGSLSGGEQQMLSIARALMARPDLLLLDEPSMGLAPLLVKVIFETIKDINRKGRTILLVEQNASMAFHIAYRGYVMQTGSIVLEETVENLKKNDIVKKSYLGQDMDG